MSGESDRTLARQSSWVYLHSRILRHYLLPSAHCLSCDGTGGLGSQESCVMTRSFTLRQLVSFPAGTAVTLMALALLAPPGAEAGCSHLVTSRTDPGRLYSAIEDLTFGVAGRSEPLPVPSPPRPCSGSWCTGGDPALPPIPAGVFDHGQLDSWAWCTSHRELDSAALSFISAPTNALCPVRGGTDVFHPPRHLPPA